MEFMPSCAGFTRASIFLRKNWMAGSSPAMTSGGNLLHQLYAAHGFEVLVVDFLAVGFGHRQAVEDLERLADIHRAALRIEGAVRREHHLLERIEIEPADGSRARGEHGGVGVEVLLEIIER